MIPWTEDAVELDMPEYGAALLDVVAADYKQDLIGTARGISQRMQAGFIAANSGEWMGTGWEGWDDFSYADLLEMVKTDALTLVTGAAVLDRYKDKSAACRPAVLDAIDHLVIAAIRAYDAVESLAAGEED